MVYGPTKHAVAASGEDEAMGALPAGYAGYCCDYLGGNGDDHGVYPSLY